MTDTTTATPAAAGEAGERPELERERLVLEARRLVADAGGVALSAEAAARFGEIEHRLDELRAAPPERAVIPAGRAVAHQSRPDPYAEFGAHDGPPSLVPSREDVVRLHNAVRGRTPLHVGTQPVDFAAVTTTNTGVGVQYLDGPSLSPRRLAEVARLGAENIGLGNRAAFPIFGPGAADVVSEGAAKPEYAAITAGSLTPSMIAVWTDLTVQAEGILAFESRLRSKLSALVARREDQLLIATVAGTTGTQTHTAPLDEAFADSLLAAAAMVNASELGADADVAVVNPADVPTIFAGGTGITGESPDSRFRLTVHGMTCYVSSAQAAGTALVGSWAAASRLIVGLAPTFAVDPYTGFKNNIVTVRLEEAVGLAVEEPSAFVEVTFDDGA